MSLVWQFSLPLNILRYMSAFRIFGLSVFAAVILILPQFAFARDYSSRDDQTARLSIYLRVEGGYVAAPDPWRFQVYVGGADARPYQFEGSANGTLVTLDANVDFDVTVSERYGYRASFSGMCSGELRRFETASCYIVMTPEYRDGYPYPYPPQYPPHPYPQYPVPQPHYPQPVSVITNYIPSNLPNTGFDPSMGPATIAFAVVFVLGTGIVLYPYARKIIASVR